MSVTIDLVMLLKKIKSFNKNLTSYSESEPLNILSIFVIVFLDILLLSFIFSGLSDHSSQIKTSSEYVPYIARNIFIESNWTNENQLNKLQNVIQNNSNLYKYGYGYSHKKDPYDKDSISKMHPLSKTLYEKLYKISIDQQINQLFDRREELQKQYSEQIRIFRENKPVYEIELLEKIARRDSTSVDQSAVEDIAKRYSKKINNLNQKILGINQQLNNQPLIVDLWGFISKDNESILKKDLKVFDYWYPIKLFLWQVLFLLPILIFAYLWYLKSYNNNKNIQRLISSHLLLIATIPIIFRLIDIFLELLPNHILSKLFKLLNKLHLVAIWHYLLIATILFGSLLLTTVIQKKLFNKQKVARIRINRSQCIRCGSKIPLRTKYCICCGANQFSTCTSCGLETYKSTLHCMNCGINNQD